MKTLNILILNDIQAKFAKSKLFYKADLVFTINAIGEDCRIQKNRICQKWGKTTFAEASKMFGILPRKQKKAAKNALRKAVKDFNEKEFMYYKNKNDIKF